MRYILALLSLVLNGIRIGNFHARKGPVWGDFHAQKESRICYGVSNPYNESKAWMYLKRLNSGEDINSIFISQNIFR